MLIHCNRIDLAHPTVARGYGTRDGQPEYWTFAVDYRSAQQLHGELSWQETVPVEVETWQVLHVEFLPSEEDGGES